MIPSTVKFLGESCKTLADCTSPFVAPFVRASCAPTNNDSANPNPKCVVKEEIAATNKECTCDSVLGGFLYCESKDCFGSLCVLDIVHKTSTGKTCNYEATTFTQQLKWTDGGCSNCRKSTDAAQKPCKTYDGSDAMKTDSSKVGIAAGGSMLGAAGAVGVGLFIRKRQMRKPEQGDQRQLLEMGNSNAQQRV